MSFFGVTVETIDVVKKHPEADRLSLCTVVGMDYQFVTGLDEYKPGDKVVYFPIDSILPDGLISHIGFAGKLSGSQKNRVKTIKLRGYISQGIVQPIILIYTYLIDKGFVSINADLSGIEPEELTIMLGVVKWDPEIINSGGGVQGNHVRVKTLPEMVHYIDIEGAQKNLHAVEQLRQVLVSVSEKMEGSCHSSGTQFKLINGTIGTKLYVCSHNKNLEIIEGDPESWHPFIDIAKKQGLLNFAEEMLNIFSLASLSTESMLSPVFPKDGSFVTVYGEFCGPGVQRNIYHLLEPKVFVFDILYNHKFLDVAEFRTQCQVYEIQTVPILAYNVMLDDWLQGKTIQEASNGKSVLYDTMREGIVIKPMVEQYSEQLHGRLILKQRSPDYLVREKE